MRLIVLFVLVVFWLAGGARDDEVCEEDGRWSCQGRLERLRKEVEEFQENVLDVPGEVLTLDNRCGKKRKATARVRPEMLEQVGVVFAWIVHEETDLALEAARFLASIGGLRSYFVFHMDKSSFGDRGPLDAFVQAKQGRAVRIDPEIDVEWGMFSFVEAQIQIMETAQNQWDDWDNIVFLSGSDLPIGSGAMFERFFERNAGLNHFGSGWARDSAEKPWPYMLNDLIVSCDNTTVSLGFRKHPIELGLGVEKQLFMGNTQQVISRAFAEYVVKGEDPNFAKLKRVLRYTASVDESFLLTLFMNSPFCHELINLTHEREYFLYFWTTHLDKVARAKYCRTALNQTPQWLCGLRPLELDEEDVDRMMFYPNTLFVRKMKMVKTPKLVHKILHEDDQRKNRLIDSPIDFRIAKRSGKTMSCLTVVSSVPTSFQWSVDGCQDRRSVFYAKCSRPLNVQRVLKDEFHFRGDGLCVIKSRHALTENQHVCLTTRDKYIIPGQLVGLNECQSYYETQTFQFGHRGLRSGAKIVQNEFSQGLCVVVEGSSGNTLQLVPCDEQANAPQVVFLKVPHK